MHQIWTKGLTWQQSANNQVKCQKIVLPPENVDERWTGKKGEMVMKWLRNRRDVELLWRNLHREENVLHKKAGITCWILHLASQK